MHCVFRDKHKHNQTCTGSGDGDVQHVNGLLVGDNDDLLQKENIGHHLKDYI
jgi:hypothetical protein